MTGLMLMITPKCFCTPRYLFTHVVIIKFRNLILKSTHPSDGLHLFCCDFHRCYSSRINSQIGRLLLSDSCCEQHGWHLPQCFICLLNYLIIKFSLNLQGVYFYKVHEYHTLQPFGFLRINALLGAFI